MSFDESKREASDEELELALRNFRNSVHSWSDQEFGRARAVEPVVRYGMWSRMRSRTAAVVLSTAVAVTAITVPVSMHYRRQSIAARISAAERDNRVQIAARQAEQQAAASMSDEELLSHLDSDIAQAAPDAFEPLASLMEDSKSK